MEITHRQNRSVYMAILHALIKPFKPKLVSSSKTYPAGSQKLIPHTKAKKLCDIKERQVEGLYIYDMTTKNVFGAAKPVQRPRRIYYFAGGGWQAPPSPQHWKLCAEICQRLPDTTVSVVSHPLAPSSPGITAFPQISKTYATVLRQAADANESVVLAGDSSGGNVILSLVLHALTDDSKAPHPDALLVISPALNLEPMKFEGKYREAESHDPILTISSHNQEAEQWAAGVDAASIWISPINADPTVLARAGVKVYGITGGYDILTPDALSFRDRCQEAGVMGNWLHHDGQMHCFPLAWVYGLPESVQATEWIIDRLNETP